jgi:ATP-dependent helicase/nuclease subunit A
LEELCQAHKTAEMEEALSLLYVAMTRAKHALHIIIPPIAINPSGTTRKPGFTLASLVRYGLGSGPSAGTTGREVEVEVEAASAPANESPGTSVLYEHGDPDWHISQFQAPLPVTGAEGAAATPDENSASQVAALAAEFKDDDVPPRSWRAINPSKFDDDNRTTVTDILAPQTSTVSLRGEVLHALFKRCSWHDAPLPGEAEFERAFNVYWPLASAEEREECREAFHSALSKPHLKSVFTRPHMNEGESLLLWREQPFATFSNGRLIRGIFDRATIIRRGQQVVRAEVFDFKTGHFQGTSHFLPQLELYRSALLDMFALEPGMISGKLVLTESGQVVKI